MSGTENEDKPCATVNEEESTENVVEEVQYEGQVPLNESVEVPERLSPQAERSDQIPIEGQITLSERFDQLSLKGASFEEITASQVEGSVKVQFKKLVQRPQIDDKNPIEGETSRSKRDLQDPTEQSSQAESGVLDPVGKQASRAGFVGSQDSIEGQASRSESSSQDSIAYQASRSESSSQDSIAYLASRSESSSQDSTERRELRARFAGLKDSLELLASRAGFANVQDSIEGQAPQTESSSQGSIEGHVPRSEGSSQDSSEGQESQARFVGLKDSLELHASCPRFVSVQDSIEGQTPQTESGSQNSSEGQESRARFVGLKDSLELQASRAEFVVNQESVDLQASQAGFVGIHDSNEGQASRAEFGIHDSNEGQASRAEFYTYELIEGQVSRVELGIHDSIEGEASGAESLVDFVLEGGLPESIDFQVPLERRDLSTLPVEDLPEISVQNILRCTRGRTNQLLYLPDANPHPYMTLTQKMFLDEAKEIVDLTKERKKKKKKRHRCKFENDTSPSLSSSSEESLPPRSEPSSNELQFPIDL